MKVIEFFVPGIPKPAGSKRGFVLRRPGMKPRAIITDDCKTSKDWKGDVKHFAHVAMIGKALIQDGPIALTVRFIMVRPKSHYGVGKNSAVLKSTAPLHHTSKPDATKLLRCVEDAITGTAWKDDALIAEQFVTKVYGDNPGAYITIKPIEKETP